MSIFPTNLAFQTQIRADERRILSRVTVGYTFPEMDPSIGIVVSEQANVSYPAQIADTIINPRARYASLDGAWVLGQDFILAPLPADAQFWQMGWWGSQLAGAGGSFATPFPMLTVTFNARPIHSLNVTGDRRRNEWPVDFIIRLFNAAGVLLQTFNILGNVSVDWSQSITPIVDVTRMELEIHRWSHSGRQVKILEFYTAVQETYGADDIMAVELLEEREVMQTGIPIGVISANEIMIKLDNSTRRFDAGNIHSPLLGLLKPNRRIRAELGAEWQETTEVANPPAFSRQSWAYRRDGSVVGENIPRFEAGRFGQAVMVEELVQNLAAPLTTTPLMHADWAVDYPSSVSVRVTALIDNPGRGPWHIGLVAAAYGSMANESVTFSFAFERTTPHLHVIANGFGSIHAIPLPGGRWTRTIRHVATWQHLFGVDCIPENLPLIKRGDSITIIRPQMESRAHHTTFHDWVRHPEYLSIPTLNVLSHTEATVEFIWTPQQPIAGIINQATSPIILQVGNYFANNSLTLWAFFNEASPGTAPRLVLFVRGSTAPGWSIQATVRPHGSGWYVVDQPIHIAVRWQTANTFFVTVNGVTYGPYVIADALTGIAGNRMWLGTDQIVSFPNALYEDVRISSRARTSTELSAAFNSNTRLPVDADTTYKLNLDGNLSEQPRASNTVTKQEFLPLGTFWSSEWAAPRDKLYVHTTGRDRLELLRKSTYNTSWVQTNVTLHALAVTVLQDAGLIPADFQVDPELLQITVPRVWFDTISHREALRLIAEAALGQVYCDRFGRIRVEGSAHLFGLEAFVMPGFAALQSTGITADEYFRKDNPSRHENVANVVEVKTQPLTPVAAVQDVFRSTESVSIMAGQTLTLTAFYTERPVIEAVASIEAAPTGTSVVMTHSYGWGANVNVHSPTAGTFILVIRGRPLKVLGGERVIAEDAVSIREHGRLRYVFPDNPLVQSRAVAQRIANIILRMSQHPRRDLELDWRGNPALLPGSVIATREYDRWSHFYITRHELNYDGGLRSHISARRAN